MAKKIVRAIVRAGERFGGKYVEDVLVGADAEQIDTRGHGDLNVYGMLDEYNQREIRAWIEQLASEGFLDVGIEYRTFSLTGKGWALFRDEHEVALFERPELRRKTTSRTASKSSRVTTSSERPATRPGLPMLGGGVAPRRWTPSRRSRSAGNHQKHVDGPPHLGESGDPG